VLPGSTTPVDIDKLAYTYESFSNKLKSVADNGTAGAKDGLFGDFKDVANVTDYVYDDNGNLVIDLNKNVRDLPGAGANGIVYNFLDKPEQIRISGKGTIKIVYDAEGNKLQKVYTPVGGATSKTTTYINQFVYEENNVAYINFEEGRVRVIQPVSQNNGYDGLSIAGNIALPIPPSGGGGAGAFDYFIRDYQENVRMILTEETHYSIGQATMETSRALNEEPVFGQAGAANEVTSTRTAKPPGWTNNTTSSVSKLSKLTGKTIGPNSLLKVMAGDVLNASADYYYPAAVTNNTNSLVSDIVTNLVLALGGSGVTSAGVKSGTSGISTNLNGSIPFAGVADPNRTSPGTVPRAYLNIMFFDERFNFVAENSTAVRVSQPGSGVAPLVLPVNTKAPKNGYVYIYLSNQSNDAVFFDNLQVSFTRGRIIEENHYYSFGLKIAGISSKKLGDSNEGMLQNNYQYQGSFSEMDEDIGWNDFTLRNYDPQIGRWVQQDPYDEYPSPYTGMGNDPVNNIDPNGGNIVTAAVLGGVGGFIAGGIYALANDKNPVTGALLGAAGGALLGAAVSGGAGDLLGSLSTKAVGQIGSRLIVQGANIALQQIVTEANKQGGTKTYTQGDKIQINRGGKNIGTVEVSTFANTSSKTKGSVRIELKFKNKGSGRSNFNWIQTVRSNFAIGSNVNKPTEINDSEDPPLDNKPFYWADVELPTENVAPGYDARFYDAPTRGLRQGQALYWKGELSLVGKGSDGSYSSLLTIGYGYKIDKKGNITVQNIRKIVTPSKFQSASIKKAK